MVFAAAAHAGVADAIHKSLQLVGARGVKKGKMEQAAADEMIAETMSRISGDAQLSHVTDSADLIIEVTTPLAVAEKASDRK